MIGSSKSYENFVRSFVEQEEKAKFKVSPRISMYVFLTTVGIALVLVSSLTDIFGKVWSQVVCVIGVIFASFILLIFWEIYKKFLVQHTSDEDTMLS